MRRSLMLTLMTWSVLSVPGLALAAEGGTGGWVGPFAVIAAGIGMGIASGLCGLAQGRATAGAALTATGIGSLAGAAPSSRGHDTPGKNVFMYWSLSRMSSAE